MEAISQINTIIVWIVAGIVGYFILATLRAIFWPSKQPVRKYQPPHIGDITLEELSKCSGEDPFRPILVAIRGSVYDVSEARNFYGPGASYHVYAGKEAARALGKMSLSTTECTADVDDLNEKEMEILEQWESKFKKKYKIVGQVRTCSPLLSYTLLLHNCKCTDTYTCRWSLINCLQ